MAGLQNRSGRYAARSDDGGGRPKTTTDPTATDADREALAAVFVEHLLGQRQLSDPQRFDVADAILASSWLADRLAAEAAAAAAEVEEMKGDLMIHLMLRHKAEDALHDAHAARKAAEDALAEMVAKVGALADRAYCCDECESWRDDLRALIPANGDAAVASETQTEDDR